MIVDCDTRRILYIGATFRFYLQWGRSTRDSWRYNSGDLNPEATHDVTFAILRRTKISPCVTYTVKYLTMNPLREKLE